MTPLDNNASAVDISVVIGRVSTEDSDRILETIDAFALDADGIDYEIVIADRLGDRLTSRLPQQFPKVRLIECPASTSLPEMRTIALDASRGRLVAVTEDHCVPRPGWLRVVREEFSGADGNLVALGGSVINGLTDTGLDWATYLCEYSFFSPPVAEGTSAILPGMNVAYRRDVLQDAKRSDLVDGFWETTLHPKLLAAGGRLKSINALKMYHCKKFSFSLFARQRFIYSRYYSGLRAQEWSLGRRLAVGLASLALPPILLWRMYSSARSKGLLGEFVLASPYLIALVIIWAVGESVGSIAGSGNALSQIE